MSEFDMAHSLVSFFSSGWVAIGSLLLLCFALFAAHYNWTPPYLWRKKIIENKGDSIPEPRSEESHRPSPSDDPSLHNLTLDQSPNHRQSRQNHPKAERKHP